MKNKFLLFIMLAGVLISGLIISCKKDRLNTSPAPSPFPTPVANPSFTEEFDTVGKLSAKGWVFVNNSNPPGYEGWRQGRYEASNIAQYSFLAPVPFVGFPAYSAHATPNDFVSCDVSSGNDQNGTAITVHGLFHRSCQ